MLKLNITLMFLVLFITVSGCNRITDTVLTTTKQPDNQPLTVLTYNVYVGSSAEPLLNVQELSQVPSEVAKMYANVIAADFPSRAIRIAKSVKEHNPHVIGLQEISLIRHQSPSDFLPDNPTLAEEVVLDYLQLILDALETESLDYKVAAQVENLDIEMPMVAETGLDDIRLTDYDVILARSDVEINRQVAVNFGRTLQIEMLGLEIPRGYTAVDATIAGSTYRIVNTHLEAFIEPIRVSQTQELVDVLSAETLPIILLGDFNTRATEGTGYNIILGAGYVDVWQMDSEGTGNTCCQDDDILNEISDLTVRIDQIFVRNLNPTSVVTHTVGDKPQDRLASGLWPSDHAGVVAQFEF